MDARDVIKIGMSAERMLVVPTERTVGHFVLGMPMVYATPMMILEMELASGDAIRGHLQPGWVTVGTEVDIRRPRRVAGRLNGADHLKGHGSRAPRDPLRGRSLRGRAQDRRRPPCGGASSMLRRSRSGWRGSNRSNRTHSSVILRCALLPRLEAMGHGHIHLFEVPLLLAPPGMTERLVLLRQDPSKALRRRGDRAGQDGLHAVRSHQHFQRGGGGTAGRGDVLAAVSWPTAPERCSSSPEPESVSRASLFASSAGQAGGDAGAREFLGQQENVEAGPEPGHRRSPRPSGFPGRPIPPSRWRQQHARPRPCVGHGAEPLLAATATVMPRPIAAGVFGMARTTLPPKIVSSASIGGSPRHDRDHRSVDAPTNGFNKAPASRNDCGFTATTGQRIDFAGVFGRWVEPDALGDQRADIGGRMRLDHHHAFGGVEALSQPAGQHRAVPSCRRRQGRDGAVDVLEVC